MNKRLTPSLLLLCSALANADIVTDGSLGAAASLTGPDFAITADLGRQRGTNLFHSFSQFNIAAGESATFLGGAEHIDNIISRITGGNSSTIDGLLRSDVSGANLFLLNPAIPAPKKYPVMTGDNGVFMIIFS